MIRDEFSQWPNPEDENILSNIKTAIPTKEEKKQFKKYCIHNGHTKNNTTTEKMNNLFKKWKSETL